MLGIVGCLVENDELDHWFLLSVWRSDKFSDNRIDRLRDVVNKAARDYVPVNRCHTPVDGFIEHTAHA
jgi:hypothetical protein